MRCINHNVKKKIPRILLFLMTHVNIGSDCFGHMVNSELTNNARMLETYVTRNYCYPSQ